MTENHQKYSDQLLKAFPQTLKNDVLKVIEILPLDQNKVKLADGNIHLLDDLIHPSTYTVILWGEYLIIPYRVYFNEPTSDNEASLSKKQQAILNCIFLRHHNGYLRQKRLENLQDNFEEFIVPFTLQLLGEHVIQILYTLDKQIHDGNINYYKWFIYQNPLFWRRTQKRMVSYWNAYYRHSDHEKLKDYIGTLIVEKLKKRPHNSK